MNVGSYVSANQVRQVVLGYETRPASSQELERMKQLVARSMEEGALGLVTRFESGGPEHPEEIVEMARVVASYGGIYASHIGSEGFQQEKEINFAVRLAEEDYATNARVLGYYARQQQVLTLEDAIRKMTSLPAQILGLRDRGLVREGLAADLGVFDPAKVAEANSFGRPKAYAEGVPYVLVNGVIVMDAGTHTGARPGRPVYGTGYRRSTPTN